MIWEYRRFIYLSQVSETELTPPEVVDRAWHMHLTFTRDYWEVFCPTVLGRAMHHDPCSGDEDMPRYREQYEQTMALYRQEFGGPPPDNIWRTGQSWGPCLAATIVSVFGLVLFAMATMNKIIPIQIQMGLGFAMMIGAGGLAFRHVPTPDRGLQWQPHGSGVSGGGVCGGCGGGGCGGGGCGGGG